MMSSVLSFALLLMLTSIAASPEKRSILETIQATMEQNQEAAIVRNSLKQDGWKGLVPLRSTRQDVERIYGNARDVAAGIFIYRAKYEQVDIVYSGPPCSSGFFGQLRVPEWTVLGITIFPLPEVTMSEIVSDVKRFRSWPDAELKGWISYSDDPTGVMIQTANEDGVDHVRIISYLPPPAKRQALVCSVKLVHVDVGRSLT